VNIKSVVELGVRAGWGFSWDVWFKDPEERIPEIADLNHPFISSDVQGMTINCIRIFIVTGSFLY